MIYLDYAADTPASEQAVAAFAQAAQAFGANPNATHAMGVTAKQRLDAATLHIADMLCVQPDEVVLTSGATEANNMAILGLAHAYRSRGMHLITSMMEHASVTAPMSALQAEGYEVDYVKVNADGKVDLEHLRSLLSRDTVLVSLCAVDSEVGVIQPMDQVRKLLDEYPGCRLHVDASQAVGKLPLDIKGADLWTISPHKFYGITGCGVLAVRGGLRLAPLWYGGTGASPYRSGTPALALTVSVEEALAYAQAKQREWLQIAGKHNRRLREALEPLSYVTINSPLDASPYVLNFSVEGMRAREVITMLSQKGICVSSKSACCAPAAPSHPVMAMTGDRKRATNTIRVSVSHLTTDDEIEQFLLALKDCACSLGVNGE